MNGSRKCAIYVQFFNLFFSFIIVLGGACCGIYKDSYNVSTISYLNSPLPGLSSTDSWNSFNRYHFCICMHVYTFFALYSLSYSFSWPPPLSHWCQHSSLGRTCSALLLSDFAEKKDKKKNLTFLLVWDKDSYLGSFLVIFPCIYVFYPPTGLSPLIFLILP
jgi:hypothetical protein